MMFSTFSFKFKNIYIKSSHIWSLISDIKIFTPPVYLFYNHLMTTYLSYSRFCLLTYSRLTNLLYQIVTCLLIIFYDIYPNNSLLILVITDSPTPIITYFQKPLCCMSPTRPTRLPILYTTSHLQTLVPHSHHYIY